MIRAFYTAASGLVAQANRQDVIANNIANAQTPGFKRQKVVTSSFASELESQMITALQRERPPYPDSPVSPVLAYASSAQDNSEGPIHGTGNAFDFAIDGPGAFEVNTATGTRLTRAGNFRLDTSGELCTADGEKVVGESGPILISDGKWKVDANGDVIVNGAILNKIKIVGGQRDQTKVMQGYLEGANISIVREMVDMIANVRSFEANQKVVTSVDSTLDKLINSAGS
ncbi:MAG: flagellar hook-basal body protein [Armatimonadota bacterium]|nr:flagellar hook-basal body protein [bacterium]